MPEPLKIEIYIEDEKEHVYSWEHLSTAQQSEFAEQLSETFLNAFSYQKHECNNTSSGSR